MANFFENVSRNRMITLTLALVAFSVLIFVVEEYVEESDEFGDYDLKRTQEIIKADGKNSNENTSSKQAASITDDCYRREPFQVLQKCIACSEFEIKAIKAKHCFPTGFFDRINCTKSGTLTLRPCTKINQASSFYTFVILNCVVLCISSVVSTKRKEFLDGKSYMRVQQQIH